MPVLNAINPRIENIPIELKTSNPEFEKATIKALSVNLEPSGR